MDSENDKEKMTIGEIIDILIENPALVIKEFSKVLEDCKKTNKNLEIKLKQKQAEIAFLRGQLAVYEKFSSLEDLENE